jgi:hypothetical protein
MATAKAESFTEHDGMTQFEAAIAKGLEKAAKADREAARKAKAKSAKTSEKKGQA